MSTATLKEQSSIDEVEIRAVIETVHKGHHHKDAAAIVAPYARDAVVCDLAPPLSLCGMNLQTKQVWLDTWEGPIDRESRDFKITVSGNFAFCHGFYRLSGTPKAAGRPIGFWIRATGSSTSTRPRPFTWMAACAPPLTSNPDMTHRDTRTNGLIVGFFSVIFVALGDSEREAR